MPDEDNLEPENITKENKASVEKLRDLLNGLKIVEEYERTIPPKPDHPGK
jgi:hypothetical protein